MITETEKTILVKAYTKAELAHMYNPEMSYSSAMRSLRAWIEQNKLLTGKLKTTGYKSSQHTFTPKQVELIFTYLGIP